MADAIFISYRRDDSEGEAGRLFDDLTRAFGDDAVFMDVTGIKPGVDFREVIEDNVAVCGVFLAIIGPLWATIANKDGVRRLDDPRDFVALELASALSRKVPVIPVLVHDAKMPSAEMLPEHLKAFSYRNSVELSHTRWSSDVKLLIQALKPYIAPPKLSVQPPVHATIPVQLPPPHPPAMHVSAAPARSKTPLLVAIVAGMVLAAALLAFFISRSKPTDGTSQAAKTDPSPAFRPTDPLPQPSAQTQQPAQQPAQPGSTLLPAPPLITGPQHPGLAGRWKSPVQRTGNSLQRLVISVSGDTMVMHPYGSCQPIECDWGTQPVIFADASATSVFRLDPYMDIDGTLTHRLVRIVAVPNSGDLKINVENTFENSTSGTRNSVFVLSFVPDQ